MGRDNLTMNPTDLAFASALHQADLIRQKQLSPLEVTTLYLDRIERLNPHLGSYFTVMGEQAIAQATAQTETLAQSDPSALPPFFGVPISIKDLNPVAGVPCSYGNRALLQQEAPYDDGVVMRIRGAGFVLLGKTATSELGSFPYTEPEGLPPARNPWDLDYTPGGSSGGAAVAVAAGLCALAQGSDGGGSIRGPAACCGIVGIKPSRGRITHAPVGDRLSGIATNGPLGRSVADAAALLDVLSGYVTGDPYWLPNPAQPFVKTALEGAQRGAGRSLRIGFSSEIQPIGQAVAPYQQAVERVAQHLEGLGHQLIPTQLDLAGLVEPFTTVWQAGVAAAGLPPEILSPVNRWLLERSGSCASYLQAVAQMQVIARQIVGLFESLDVLITPVYLHSPIRVGAWADLAPEVVLEKMTQWIAFSPPFNASGQPAIALPVGLDEQGLPIALQLVGKPGDEATIIALAAHLEATLPTVPRQRPTALQALEAS